MTSYWPAQGSASGSPYWGDAVANVAALPATGTAAGEIRYVIDVDTLYLWNGAAWGAIVLTELPVNLASQVTGVLPEANGGTGSATGFSDLSTDVAGKEPAFAVLPIAKGGTGSATGFSDLSTTVAGKVPLAGGTMSGALVLNADPAVGLGAATKQYVDSIRNGLRPKDPVRAGTTANITLSAPQTIDGVSVIAADRVLVRAQTAPAENGVYIVAAGAWTRATDFDAWAEVPGAQVIIQEGTTLADTGWLCTANDGGTLGTTAIAFAQAYGPGSLTTDSQGLALTGSQLALVLDGGTLVKSGSGIRLAGATATEVAYLSGVSGALQAQLNAKVGTADTIAINRGGTGQTTANAGLNALLPSQTTHANKVLKSDGTNTAWGLLVNANIDAAAAIEGSKIASVVVGTSAGVVPSAGLPGRTSGSVPAGAIGETISVNDTENFTTTASAVLEVQLSVGKWTIHSYSRVDSGSGYTSLTTCISTSTSLQNTASSYNQPFNGVVTQNNWLDVDVTVGTPTYYLVGASGGANISGSNSINRLTAKRTG